MLANKETKKLPQKTYINSEVTGRIKRILDQVEFDGKFTFITELLQNCQRSGSTRVDITLEGDLLRIADNGKGCADHEELFTLDMSGFGIGFGVGFASVYALLGKVHVHTLDWQGEIDMGAVAKKAVITEEDLGVSLLEAPFYQGFIVTLRSEIIEQYETRIAREIRKVSCTMMDFECVLNGEIIPKKDLYAVPTTSRFYQLVDHSLYKGILYVDTLQEYKGVDVYYEDRFVQNLYHGLTGLSGNIIVKKNKVNLKAPDRTAIIWDEKREVLQAKLEKDLRNLLVWLLKEGTPEEIEQHAGVIRIHIPVEKFLRYLSIDEGQLKNQFQVREGVNEQDSSDEIESETKTSVFDCPLGDIERHQEDVAFSSFVTSTNALERATKEDLHHVNLSNIKKKANVVWVEKDRKELYQETISKYEYYGIYTFVSPHELFDEGLRYLGITHIANVESEAIEKQYDVKNIGAKNKKEMRVMEVLAMIEHCFDLPQTFYVSDIQCKMLVSLQEKRIYQEMLHVAGYHQSGLIHLDRKSVSFGKVTGANLGKTSLNTHELAFLLANIELISHELAHLLYGTEDNSLEHADAIFNVQKQIGQFILNLK